MRRSLRQYIDGGIAAAEGYANLAGRRRPINRQARSAGASRSSGS